MGRNKDRKIARKYHLPVELLQEGLPQALRDAPDDEVRSGRLFRVCHANILKQALTQEAPGRNPTLQVYIVPYMPPFECVLMREILEDQKEGKKQIREDGDAAAAPLHRRFVLANPLVFEAKEMALMALKGEIAKIDVFTEKLLANPKKYPHEIDELPRTNDDFGLNASEKFQDLKERFFVSRARTGNLGQAKRILKQVDRTYYKSLFQSFPMEQEEEEALLVKVAADYEEALGLVGKPVDGTEIAMQLLGLVSFADFEDKKKLIVPDDYAFADKKSVLKRLKRQKKKFDKLAKKETLIGAALPNFREL